MLRMRLLLLNDNLKKTLKDLTSETESVSKWAHIDALIKWLTINGICRCCLQIISPPAVGTLCSTWNVGPGNVPVMGSQDH